MKFIPDKGKHKCVNKTCSYILDLVVYAVLVVVPDLPSNVVDIIPSQKFNSFFRVNCQQKTDSKVTKKKKTSDVDMIFVIE